MKFIGAQFADPAWRLNNLYWIVNKDGKRVRFQFNWAQAELYRRAVAEMFPGAAVRTAVVYAELPD